MYSPPFSTKDKEKLKMFPVNTEENRNILARKVVSNMDPVRAGRRALRSLLTELLATDQNIEDHGN